jgi:hypothetical protein
LKDLEQMMMSDMAMSQLPKLSEDLDAKDSVVLDQTYVAGARKALQ